MKKPVKSILATVALTAAIAMGGVAAPAQAAPYGYVYLVANQSVCTHVRGTSPTGFLVTNTTIGWTLTQWDTGDRVVYPRVELNRTNRITLKIACRNCLGITLGYVDRYLMPIYPTAHNQTINFS